MISFLLTCRARGEGRRGEVEREGERRGEGKRGGLFKFVMDVREPLTPSRLRAAFFRVILGGQG